MARTIFFGLVADVQHADKDDSHSEERTQRLRQAAGCLDAAVTDWLSKAHQLSFILTLGDIIDGNLTEEATASDFERVAAKFDRLTGSIDVHHVIGNHCLSVERDALRRRLGISANYRTVCIGGGWRLILLDTSEVSGHSGYPVDSPLGREAAAYLAAHPMSDSEPNMALWNGGISAEQLRWLKSELVAAEAAGNRVIVAAHHQAGEGAARATHMAWNWRDIQAALLDSTAFVAYLAGHDHMGGYSASLDGRRHFVTLEAMLEAPEGGNAYAFVEVNDTAIRIHGRGAVTSRELRFI